MKKEQGNIMQKILNKQENHGYQNINYTELMKTILYRSIKHYLEPSSKSDFLSQQKWIFKKTKEFSWVFSFQFICEELEFDCETLRKKIKNLAEDKNLPFLKVKRNKNEVS